MARYEGSKEDQREDKKGAKRAGLSMAGYEHSLQDKREDAAGQKKLDHKGKK